MRHIVDTDTGRLVVPGLRCGPLDSGQVEELKRVMAAWRYRMGSFCST